MSSPAGRLVVNALGGLGNPNLPRLASYDTERPTDPEETPFIDARALREARASGLTAVTITLGHVAGAGDPFQTTLSAIAAWDAFLADRPRDLLKATSAAHILEAQASGRVGVVFGFQNTTMFQGDATRAELFRAMGVRVVQLTYNDANDVGGGCRAPEQGLTPFGRELLDRLHTCALTVDLSHSGARTFREALAASPRPVWVSHTGCRALADYPRNRTDGELRALADHGGVAGIFAMPFLVDRGQPMAQDFLRHLEHAVQVCGEDHVGIGTDGPVTAIDDPQTALRGLQEEVAARQGAGIASPGEGPGALLCLPDLTGPDQFRRLAELLQARGHTCARIDKLLGGNFLRLAADTWERTLR